tara:strand:+ start:2158 stop:2898 length:741 start_codon:yes stop_codon:yes gene_type:complete
MVKNKQGGKNAKKMGRKFTAGSIVADRRIRYSECDEEKYACVTSYYGGGNIEVMCIDGESRIGIIRKKFRGRSKRDNMITVGTYVLVGIRDWEVVAKGKKRKCDLLEVYSAGDIKQIQRYLLPEEWETIRNKNDDKKTDYEEENMIEFVDEETVQYIQHQEQRVAVNKNVDDDDLWNIGNASGNEDETMKNKKIIDKEESSEESEESSAHEKQPDYKVSQRTGEHVTKDSNKVIVDDDEEIDIDDI